MIESACETSRQPRPAMEPESSIRRAVSKVARKAYGSSPVVAGVCDGEEGASSPEGRGESLAWGGGWGGRVGWRRLVRGNGECVHAWSIRASCCWRGVCERAWASGSFDLVQVVV
jgi:hypothetical protein